jgi:hypothetical protein
VPLKAGHRHRDRFVVGTEDLSHVLGVEPDRKGGRTDEVGEHHSQITALGAPGFDWRPREAGFQYRRPAIGLRTAVGLLGKGRDRREELLAVAQRHDTKLPQIVRRQAGQRLCINVVVAKRLLVSIQPEAAQPSHDFHVDLPRESAGP